jgi:hypothetical protein
MGDRQRPFHLQVTCVRTVMHMLAQAFTSYTATMHNSPQQPGNNTLLQGSDR